MDSLYMLLQDWIALVFTVLIILGMAYWWFKFLRKALAEPTMIEAGLIVMIVATMAAGGLITLIWGGRAYLLAHRTEANNVAAEEHEEQIMATPDLDEDLVEKIRREREETEKRRKRDEEDRKNREARKASDDYLKALENKEEKR